MSRSAAEQAPWRALGTFECQSGARAMLERVGFAKPQTALEFAWATGVRTPHVAVDEKRPERLLDLDWNLSGIAMCDRLQRGEPVAVGLTSPAPKRGIDGRIPLAGCRIH